MKFVVVRKAVLQEDEGHEHLIELYDSLGEAAAWIGRQRGQYHPPSDYYVARLVKERDGTGC